MIHSFRFSHHDPTGGQKDDDDAEEEAVSEKRRESLSSPDKGHIVKNAPRSKDGMEGERGGPRAGLGIAFHLNRGRKSAAKQAPPDCSTHATSLQNWTSPQPNVRFKD